MLFKADAKTPKTLKKADFGRLIGVSPGLVTQFVRAGLRVTATGRIDVDAGRKWLDENVDQARRETWKRACEADSPEVPHFRFAQIIRASPATVSRHVKAGLPVEPNGRIDLRARKAAEDGEDLPGDQASSPSIGVPLLTARGQRDVAEAEISRLKAEKMAGRLIDQKATLRAVEGRAGFERDAWIGWVSAFPVAPTLPAERNDPMLFW